MCRKLSWFAGAAVLLFPAALLAGGPPWLCLPIEGVKSENVATQTEMLAAKLDSKLWPQANQFGGIRLQENEDQQYLVFHMRDDVALGDVDRALKGSGLSIPREKLRLFGHVILEITARDAAKEATQPKELLAALEAIAHVSVVKSENKDDRLHVTVEMPYPTDYDRPEHGQSVTWSKFQRWETGSNPAIRSGPVITAQQLPSYDDFRQVVGKYNAALKDIRWSTNYACRPVGCVIAPQAKAVTSTN